MKKFIKDHPVNVVVTGLLIGMIVFELFVIDAADKVIGDLGGWD